jgi:hypothetical protein
MTPDTENPMSDEMTTWPDLAEGLYERLTGRGTTITYGFDDLVVEVPGATGADAPRAAWRLHGTLHVRTSEPRA